MTDDDTSPIPRLRKVTLSSMVADQLRTLVLEGFYAPGDQLNEVELATGFGVSRGSVREGLRQLVHDGLLRSETHRGVFVPRLTGEEVEDIHIARLAIEEAAARLVFLRGQHDLAGEGLLKIADSMRRAHQSSDRNRLLELYLDFHVTLVECSGSPRLTRVYKSLLDETALALRHGLPEPDGRMCDHHRVLAELFHAGHLEEFLTGIRQTSPMEARGAASAEETERND